MRLNNKRYSAKEVLDFLQVEDTFTDVESDNNASSDSDSEGNYEINCSESDDSDSEDENPILSSKDGVQWREIFCDERRKGRVAKENIFTRKCEVRPSSMMRIDSPYDAWRLLFTEKMLNKIVTSSNEKAKQNNKILDLTLKELERFLGLVYLRGALGMRRVAVEFLWNNEYGVEIFKNTMSRNRFNMIKKYLRFDSLEERRINKNKKFIHIQYIFDEFTRNSMQHYIPHPFLTIDEQLIPSKNRCSLIQYLPNKPDKFGIKIWMLVCNTTKYCFNQSPYLGSEEKEERNGEPMGDYVVKKLMEPLYNFGYNITADNLFTSFELCQFLLKNKTTYVGTVRLNRKFLSEEHKEKKELYKSRFFIDTTEKIISVSYQSKKKKNVVLLSSQHKEANILKGEKRKPEIVKFYNKTKAGVDIVDKMIKNYSTQAFCRRWPLAVFYNLLDKAGINAHILYKETSGKNISRKSFLINLSKELIDIKNETSTSIDSNEQLKRKRKHCQINQCENKSPHLCFQCNKIICGKHTKKQKICINC